MMVRWNMRLSSQVNLMYESDWEYSQKCLGVLWDHFIGVLQGRVHTSMYTVLGVQVHTSLKVASHEDCEIQRIALKHIHT